MPRGTLQQVQTKNFGPYIEKFIWVYLDDFAVYGDRASHAIHIKSAFKQLAMHKISLSPEKCRIGFSEETLLGHVVSKDGIGVDLEKVKRILEFMIPHNSKEVSSL
jgi:hypothetical protein